MSDEVSVVLGLIAALSVGLVSVGATLIVIAVLSTRGIH